MPLRQCLDPSPWPTLAMTGKPRYTCGHHKKLSPDLTAVANYEKSLFGGTTRLPVSSFFPLRQSTLSHNLRGDLQLMATRQRCRVLPERTTLPSFGFVFSAHPSRMHS